MHLQNALVRRQIWASPSTTSSAHYRHCTPFNLPSNGVISLNPTSTITLSRDAVFKPECTHAVSTDSNATVPGSSAVNLRDPFYASTSPQIYAIATATVISYMLVIMLFITPRTFFVGGAGFLGRRGAGSGSTSIVGVGGRPWLQKFATLTVAVSLTIATVNTFRVAEQQYNDGYQDAIALTDEVVGGLEIRVIRVISDTLLWLAQVQTLIRLFPRHKEKVIIKWTGLALIALDTIFTILNNFVENGSKTRPRSFTDAIPALTYLFELALSLLYAAWVIYYSFEKRRFAFLHRKMRNIILVAMLSLTAILIPVVFFVLDISKPTFAGWGDYVRWVGAAAASVVVWEWVERIEALEREERKEGILGREIFDGDEMLDVTPSSEVNWPGSRPRHQRPGGGGGIHSANTSGCSGALDVENPGARCRVPPQYSQHARQDLGPRVRENVVSSAARGSPNHLRGPTPPSMTASPISRSDTVSAASTIYAVHYHPTCESTSPGFERTRSTAAPGVRPENPAGMTFAPDEIGQAVPEGSEIAEHARDICTNQPDEDSARSRVERTGRWRNLTHPFKRRRTTPPPEVSQATIGATTNSEQSQGRPPETTRQRSRAVDKLRFRRHLHATDAVLPIVIIPAQPGGGVWSPAESADQEGRGVGSSPVAKQPTIHGEGRRTDGARNAHAPSVTRSFHSNTQSRSSLRPVSEEMSPTRDMPMHENDLPPVERSRAGPTPAAPYPAPNPSVGLLHDGESHLARSASARAEEGSPGAGDVSHDEATQCANNHTARKP